ncbi:MAG TPA: sugar ABC transporter permease [Candidatus Binatia bacterium]|jgi:trehalose/maltose transport system permease protein|nr:sugar ABC transporter permease [Candidatus Binatia bacterium]
MSAESVPVDQNQEPVRPKKQGISDLAKREERLAYLLLIPTLIILFVIAFYPLGSVFYNSLTNRQFAGTQETQFVGLRNYSNLLSLTVVNLEPKVDDNGQIVRDPDTGEIDYPPAVTVLPREPKRYRELAQFSLFGNRYVIGASDAEFVRAIYDTVAFTVVTVVLETILGLGIALVVNSEFKGRGMMRVVMLVPWAIPTAVSSRMWEWMFKDTRAGFFNILLQRLGLGSGQIPFLVDQAWQLPAMIAIDVWKTTPFMALLLLAGLQLIPADLYEAADVDGAGKLRQFWSVTLPLLRPTLAVALVFRTLDAVRVFDLFQIVLAQSRYSMASYAYYSLIDSQQMGYSSAASVVIFFIIFVFAVLYIRMLGVSND